MVDLYSAPTALTIHKEMVSVWTAALRKSPDAHSETERALGKKNKSCQQLRKLDNKQNKIHKRNKNKNKVKYYYRKNHRHLDCHFSSQTAPQSHLDVNWVE